MSVAHVLENAIRSEREAHALYKLRAQETQNPLVRGLLEEMASDELEHAARFEKLLRSATGADVLEYPEERVPELEDRMKRMFADLAEATAYAGDQVAVLEAVLGMEKEAFAMYDDLWKRAMAEREKTFYDILRKEEYEHIVAIENVLSYLTKTGMWFDVEESKRWNWMNI